MAWMTTTEPSRWRTRDDLEHVGGSIGAEADDAVPAPSFDPGVLDRVEDVIVGDAVFVG